MPLPLNYQTPARPPVPGVLKAVAWLFIAFGILSAVDIASAALHGNVNLNLGVLGIFIGRGLLRLRPGWRTCALFFLWLTLVGVPLITLIALGASAFATIRIGGRIIPVPFVVILIPMALIWGVALWQYRVLTRPDVRALFAIAARKL